MFQGLQGLLMFAFVALHGDVNARVAQVVSHANLSHGHHSQTRIFEFESDNLRNLFTQCLRDALCPVHKNRRQPAGGSRRNELSCRLLPAIWFLEFRRRHPLDNVRLDLVANFNIVEVFQTDTTLEAFTHFRDVVLEAA